MTNCSQVLGDLVESLAGVVLVDTKLNNDKVWSIFKRLLRQFNGLGRARLVR